MLITQDIGMKALSDSSVAEWEALLELSIADVNEDGTLRIKSEQDPLHRPVSLFDEAKQETEILNNDS